MWPEDQYYCVSPRSLLEMQNVRFHPRPVESESNKIFTLSSTVMSLSLRLNFPIHKV